jgi:lipopolysaccharide/colanic/teichoic acid biosynthesis glycosyltransferase/GT2 family glycosyltransferase
MSAPRYSVIVPAYQAAGTIGLCLDALERQTVARNQYEIIVVDDGSPDGTAEIARRAGACVVTQPNGGAAAARNSGAKVAQGELLLFTDSDCAPVPGWMAALIAAFDDPRVAGAKGTYLTRQRAIVPRFTQLEYEDRYDRMLGRETIDFIDTYSAAYRPDVFWQNGGFDTSVRYTEDQEFSFRLAEKGYRLVFVPEAQVYHRHNATLRAYIRRKFFIGRWKVLVTRQHPGRLVKDSHTPEALKAQLGLAAGVLVGLAAMLVGSIVTGGLWWPGLAVVLALTAAFLLTAAPFLTKIARRDGALLLPAAGLVGVRALALGTGFASGLVGFAGQMGGHAPVLTSGQRLAKRLLDLGVSLVLLPFLALPMALIALLIKLDSRGPVFFRQTRIGQNGTAFRIFKFRTMVNGAERLLPDLVDVNGLAQPAFKLRGDPRVTRVGRILRRWSLDEAPQLINVLLGEMSLVGPRPEEAALVERYTDEQRRRLAVKPGMTGPMQVNGRGDLPFEERLRLELAYIDGYSLRKDLALLVKTLPAVAKGTGAY